MEEIGGLFLVFVPVGLLLVLANVAQRSREQGGEYQPLAWAGYGLLGAVYVITILAGLLVGVLAAAQSSTGSPMPEFPIELESIQTFFLGAIVPSVVGLLLFALPVRKLMARLIPIDPYHPVHVLSLSMSMLVIVNLMVTLGIGLRTLLEMSQESPTGPATTVTVAWVQAILFSLLALVGVGLWVRRDWQQALERLGVSRLSLRQFALGVGVAVGMVVVVLALGYVAQQAGLEPDQDVEDLTRELIGPLFESPLGIVTLGVSAALGEELIFRGAVLPRFGLLGSSVLFALVHANYGITFSTVIVLILGLVLGYVRMRENTTTAMVVHAVYNMTLGLLALLGIE